MKRENAIAGASGGMLAGLVLHSVWMIFLFQSWPLRFLDWPSRTDVLHDTILTVPRSGWEFEPVTAGLAGVICPLLFSVAGIVLGWRATIYWPVESKTVRAMAAIGGLLVALNAFLLFLLLCLEN